MATTADTARTMKPAESPAPQLQVYNTLTRRKEPFVTVQPGRVGIYLCGPTVYKPAHIGHMVGPVIFDTIKRYLAYCGYQVTWVVNITDVDDKLIVESNKRGITMAQVAEENTADYLKNLKSLGVDQIDHMPTATGSMNEIIGFIQNLIDRGFAYASEGDVYFEVSKDSDYGKLSNRTADAQQGEGGEMASRKRSNGDFALWKSAKPGEPSWDSPWGKGRPGWHIECSAMSKKILGETFDIHGGGLDLMFPHHENEIAQSESCHSKPMVKYWLHNGLMQAAAQSGKVGGKGDREGGGGDNVSGKISRSKGDGGLAELIARVGGDKLRFFLLRTHYRSTIVFSEEGIVEAGQGLDQFQRFFERYQRVTGMSFYDLPILHRRKEGEIDPAGDALLTQVRDLRAGYLTKMDDDFNTGGAVSDLFELVRALNKYVDQHQLEDAAKRDPAKLAALTRGATTFRELGALLGLFLSGPQKAAGGDDALVGKLMDLFLALRAEARARKDFGTSDRIRDGLAAAGITLEDRKGETGWRKS